MNQRIPTRTLDPVSGGYRPALKGHAAYAKRPGHIEQFIASIVSAFALSFQETQVGSSHLAVGLSEPISLVRLALVWSTRTDRGFARDYASDVSAQSGWPNRGLRVRTSIAV